MSRSSLRWMGRALLTWALLGATVGLAAAQLHGEPGHRDRHRAMPHGDWWNDPKAIEMLGLDEGLRAQIEEEVYQTHRRMVELKAQVELEQLELHRLLATEPAPPPRELEAQVDRFVAARGNVTREEILLRSRIRALLTPDQRAQLEELHELRRQHMREERRERLRPAMPSEP